MPKKISTKEAVASAPVRVAKPRVKTVKHSKAASAPVAIVEMETVTLSAHDQISKIAYGYWLARSFQPGNPEQDWLRAEQEFLVRG